MPSPRRPGHTGTTERASHLPDLARGFSIPSQVPKRRMQAPAGPADFQNPFGSPGMAGAVRPIATARGNRKGAHAMPSTTLLNPINPDFQFVQRRPQMPDGNTTKAFHFKAGSGQVPVPVGGPSFAQSQQTSQRPTNQPTSFNHRGPGSKVINSTPRAAERVNVRRAPLAAPVLPTDSPFVENAVTVQPGASGELNFDRPSQKPDESRAASGPSRGKTSHPTR